MPFEFGKYVICLEIKRDNSCSEGDEAVAIAAEEGELCILSEKGMDIHAVVGKVSDLCAEVELIGLRHYSVVYDGKFFHLPLGQTESYSFRRENGERIFVRLSYRRNENGFAEKETICRSC
ncbi:MAG: hypothetical protein IJ009_07555 [Clostridia bacterium]|nr:hypothetical protein [Clostridia bacterium]